MVRFRDFLQDWAPEKAPVTWTALNVACLVSSILLLCDIIFAQADISERSFALHSYLVWNFSTTVVWCAEIGLSFLNPGPPTLEQKVELGLAVVFTIDSLRLLIKWKIKHQDIEEALWDVLLNMVSYGYLLIRMTTRNWQNRMSRTGERQLLEESDSLLV
jgi:hypothetical protein